MIRKKVSAKAHRGLLFALESARMQLAVAIAVETKSTPRERWRYYLETTDQMSRSIKRLRKANFESLPDSREWINALEGLRNLPVQGRISRLCQILGDIALKLE